MYCYRVFILAAALCAAALALSCRSRTRTVSTTEIRVYSVEDSGFGYAIYQGDRKVIDQPNVPGVQGKMPFRSREEAENTAQLVIRKLHAHEFPPTVTIDELDSLRIHYR